MKNKVVEIKSVNGNIHLIPYENIHEVVSGDRQSNYIILKDQMKHPIETYMTIPQIKAAMEFA